MAPKQGSVERRSDSIVYAIYTRVSDDEGLRETSFSTLDNQEMLCKELIAKIRPEQSTTVIQVFSDPGVSGAKIENRPGFMKLFAAIQAGEIDCLVAYRWDGEPVLSDRAFVLAG